MTSVIPTLAATAARSKPPTLDRLAKDGLRFTRSYNTGRCWPSRAALLTGYHAQEVGRDKLPGLGGGEVEIGGRYADRKKLGYRWILSASGRWHSLPLKTKGVIPDWNRKGPGNGA